MEDWLVGESFMPGKLHCPGDVRHGKCWFRGLLLSGTVRCDLIRL